MTVELDFEKHFGPLDEKVVAALEQTWGIKFPKQYRDFLLKYNGGNPNKTDFCFKNSDNGSLLSSFFGVIGEYNYNLILHYEKIYEGRIPNNCFPIADDQCGNLILIAVKMSDYGKVYFWDHEQETEPADYSNLTLIADSFEEFINNLKSEEEMGEV